MLECVACSSSLFIPQMGMTKYVQWTCINIKKEKNVYA